ncbi:MAG TPA: glycerol-3-phosphate acyltransferase, partial [Acidimicrobiia bacterium]
AGAAPTAADWDRMGVPIVVVVAFLAGSIPFSNIAARRTRGVDLREVGTGTVSGTSLYRVAGFVPLAVAGVFDVAKGAVGPLLAGDRPMLAAVAGGVAVAGHNWSPFLRGAGGRGVAPTLGALLVNAWPGAVLLLICMIVGKALGETGAGTFVGILALVPVLAALYGGAGAAAAGSVAVPMLVKRAIGNAPPSGARLPAYLTRVVFDRDALQRA